MARYSDTIRSNTGAPLANVVVTITRSDNGALGLLTNDDGSALSNPLRSDHLGAFTFNATDAYYDLAYHYGGRLIQTDSNVAVGAPPSLAGASAYQVWLAQGNTGTQADFLASLKAASTPIGSINTPSALTAASTLDASQVLNKPDRYPTSPASTVSSDYDELYAGFTQRYYDTPNNRLFPCRGLGPDNAGCPDTSLPDSNGNKLSPWMWAMAVRVLAERVRSQLRRQATTSTAITRVQNAWNYFKTQFTTTQLTSTTYGVNQIYGLADDAALLTNAFMDIWDTTGDATALRTAIEAHACAFIMFQDTRSQNPVISYGASTPAGLVLQRNTYGHQYDQSKGLTDGSSCHEMFLAICGWRIAQVPAATVAALYSSNGTSAAQAYQTALLAQAKDIWAWAFTYLRWGGSAQAAAGIYGSLFVLNPAASNFHQLDQITTRPTTQRGHTAFADHGTVSAIILSDMLYSTTNQPQYLAEMQSALVAYPTQTTGFGRTWKGLPCLVNSQDPFTDGMWHAEATRRTLARYPNATDYSAFKLAVLGAAKMIASQSGNGSISPNWGPPEISDPNNSVPCWTWEGDSSYVGGGGNQADGRQVTTASSSMGVIQAADMLASTEAAIGSGMKPGGVEILTSQAVSALAAAAKPRFNPFMKLGGRSALRGVDVDGTCRVYIDESEGLRVGPLGVDIWKAASTHGDHYFFGNITAVNQGMGWLSTLYSGQFYAGTIYGMAGINLGAAGSSITGAANRVSITAGGTEVFRAVPGGVQVMGTTWAGFDVTPTADAQFNLGAASNRWKGGRFAQMSVNGLSVYADNASAKSGGLAAGDFYRTSTGQLMVVY